MATVSTTNVPAVPTSRRGEPTWEMALFYPTQGEWTETDYLALDANSSRMIELSDGCLEVLPMPTFLHQFIVRYLFQRFDEFVAARALGQVLPLRFGLIGKVSRAGHCIFPAESNWRSANLRMAPTWPRSCQRGKTAENGTWKPNARNTRWPASPNTGSSIRRSAHHRADARRPGLQVHGEFTPGRLRRPCCSLDSPCPWTPRLPRVKGNSSLVVAESRFDPPIGRIHGSINCSSSTCFSSSSWAWVSSSSTWWRACSFGR